LFLGGASLIFVQVPDKRAVGQGIKEIDSSSHGERFIFAKKFSHLPAKPQFSSFEVGLKGADSALFLDSDIRF
jgi:hypothetical protein